MKPKLTTDKILLAGIILLLLCIVGIVIISISESRQVDKTSGMVTHTQEVLIHSEKLLSAVTDNESASRGYIIIGKNAFINSLQLSQKEIETELSYLKELTADNPVQQVRLDSLQLYTGKRIEFSRRIATVFDLKGIDAAFHIIETGEGKLYSDHIRMIVNKIRDTENDLLVQRKNENEKKSNDLNSILITLIVALVILFVVLLQKSRVDYFTKRKAATDLAKANNELEQLVQQRTNELSHSKNTLAETFERIADGFIALDKNWNYTYINERIGEITGLSPESLIGKNVWEVFPDAVGSATYKLFHKVMREQRYQWNTDYYPPLDLWQENHVYPSSNGITVFVRDITEKKKAEQKIVKANRLYFFISQVNQMIVRTKDEATLFKEACRIAVELGKFRMAWIGMIDEQSRKVIPVMHAGEDRDYLSKIKIISLNDIAERRGPTATALKDGKYIVCNDIENDPQMAPWKEAAIGRGYHSSMSLPIKKSGKTIGAFTFYASEKHFFDDAEIALLQEATGDIAFALEVFDKERQRKKAEAETLEVYKEKETTLNRINDSMISVDNEWHYTFLNDAALSTHPLGREDTIGKIIWDVHPEMEGTIFWDKYHEAMDTKKVVEVESYYAPMNTWFSVKVYPSYNGLTIFYSNVTKRKRTEDEIKQTSEKLRELSVHLLNIREEERKRIGREIHDELGQQLTAIKMDVSWIDKKIPEENEAIKIKLKNIIALLDGGNQSIRRILNELRPVILDDHGLLEALQWQSRQFIANTGIPLDFTTTETQIKVAEEIATCIFRVFQEALTNITRYANAGKVLISLKITDNIIILIIEDDGNGFDVHSAKQHKSFGILGMKERVHSVHGNFELFTEPGKGTKIVIHIPLTQ